MIHLLKVWFWLTALGILSIIFAVPLAMLWLLTWVVKLYEPAALWLVAKIHLV